MGSVRHVIQRIARHVIRRISNPRFLSNMTSYDVASTFHQSLRQGGGRRAEQRAIRAAAQLPGLRGGHSLTVVLATSWDAV
jgi:hypothetical protein